MSDYPEESKLEKSWESAARQFNMEAVVGHLFAGTIHNLNGVVQAFSMQVDLLQSMFEQCERFIEKLKIVISDGAGSDDLEKLENLLKQRAKLTQMLRDKALFGQNILHRNVLPFPYLHQEAKDSPWPCSLNTLLEQEIDFLCADSFFKHKVDKKLSFDPSLPQSIQSAVDLHQLFFALLDNSIAAMKSSEVNGESNQLKVTTLLQDKCIEVTISDSGIGIAPDVLPRIYDPFFSTMKDKRGLGLYFAKTICDHHVWKISCISPRRPTVFQIIIPLEDM
ncbi:MAG: sensor histidine kinase [Desulfobulbaceae bacterium]|uniref:histidine kinase n=1 Tax=Candidatus Desulfobia pelagia TaxID=2841692 RepID=A0A8J6NEK3_9BACT|nr:sensor histidine kinase [Candidatus Desulfobia pelagia]